MIEAGLALHDAIVPLVGALLLVFLRIGAMMAFLPGLGDKMIPARVRLVAAFSLAAAVAPTLAAPEEITPSLIATETAIGLAFGAVLRFVALALTMAGMMAAQLTSLAQLFGTVEPSSAIGNVLNIAGLALLMASGLPLMVIDLLIRSYDVLPLGLAPDGGDMARWGIARAAGAFALAFALAAPFALLALVYNLAMGVLNRAMPQLMVAMVGAPAITWASALILFLAAPLMLTVWRAAMIAALGDPIGGGP
ncbi:flagellar biosynthesis protein FliR [Jannaschia seosinensis]|uniref:Flagellar biosynthesis protein FliR n=1 Tax=Jannaschia seosinensis TaxID=313367 RepID=A0A0M7BCX8_9RHOB|nr:flagellar biosynthetic protein FliR [Jannaschia seosinensis]CUH40657.1 flagellar biosynthesis protein FliR [Jannaschia seosinensis]